MVRSVWLVAFVAAVASACLLASSFVRIPPGEIGASRRGWLAAGWHLRAPFAPVARVPESATIDVGPVEAATPEGSARRLSVRLRYRLSASASPSLAPAAAREGLAQALRPALEEALGAALRTSRAPLARSGWTSDPIGAAFVRTLAGKGISTSDLDWRRIDASPGPPVGPLLSSRRQKLVIIGLDAADWQIADPLIRSGRLPNLARLVHEGARGPLRSYDPMISPLIWTTMATGVGPDAHGIADFTVTDGATRKTVPITSRFRKVKALWNIFSDAGLTCGFVGWWASHPAEPVRGYLVTELLGFSMMRPDGKGGDAGKGITYPEDYYAVIRPELVRPGQIGYEETSRILHIDRAQFDSAVDVAPPEHPAPGAPPHAQDPVWLVRKTLAATRDYEIIALDLLRRDLDVVAVYFEGIDMMGHRFQHCMPPRMALCSDAEYEMSREAVAAFYEYQDEVLGRLLAASSGRMVLVVSDHGFRNDGDRPPDTLPYTTNLPVDWHREYGMFVLSGPAARKGASVEKASVYDIAPTALYLAGLPSGEDMRGAVLTAAIDSRYVADNPPRRIRSYEEMGTPLSAIAAPAEASSPEAQEEMLRSLQGLGYIGPAAAEVPGAVSASRGTTGLPADSASASAVGARSEAARVFYHRNLATYLLKEGRSSDAEVELLKANEIQPLPKTYELLSEIRAGRGDVDGAVASLEEGLNRFPEMDQDAVLWIVDLRLGQGSADLASQALGRWRSRITRPAIAAACEGKIAAAAGDEERALARFAEALQSEPDLSQAALAAAPLLEARGRLAELEEPIRRALSREQRIDEYQNLLGMIRLEQGRPAEALDRVGRALDIVPTDPRFLENYALASLRTGKPQLAIERYRAALGDPRAHAGVWAGYGRLLGMIRRPAEAAPAFSKALSMGDRSEGTYAGYAASLLESGRRERSREIVREGLKAFPNSAALSALQRRIG